MKKNPTIFLILFFQAFVLNALAQLHPDSAVVRLKEGNNRFVNGKTQHPRQDSLRLKEVAKGQNPFAVIVGCSDSRVPSEIIFDEGLGDLFIV